MEQPLLEDTLCGSKTNQTTTNTNILFYFMCFTLIRSLQPHPALTFYIGLYYDRYKRTNGVFLGGPSWTWLPRRRVSVSYLVCDTATGLIVTNDNKHPCKPPFRVHVTCSKPSWTHAFCSQATALCPDLQPSLDWVLRSVWGPLNIHN